ncbi:hypothetical protein BHE90_006763 [Fusarium euwallaceae]|uniref:RING-type domain-containing protein n=2 Tax=Fusarium solani species complex TaxID=232080 RepID=A0A3M2RDR2_9HYPO|nr:hypothetical protein CDV36_015213 [Fusarium kuroshium]RTE78712.1 hypothetical protein BHE90_006763 [Fusarium euwallaceae]
MESVDGAAEHYWPNIKKAIMLNPTGQPGDQRMKPQCPLCFETFNITTFRRPSGSAPTCVVLFCGHIICRRCLGQTEEHNTGGAKKTCPCCRTELACTKCRQVTKTFTVPDANTSPDSVFDAPLTKPENPNTNADPICHRCTAGGEWLRRINNGEYPREAETIEPGAVQFFYGAVDALESEGRPVTPGSVSSAFGSVTNDEYHMLTSRRNDFMSQRRLELESANPWFGSDSGRDRHRSSSHRHEHRRETNVFDYQETNVFDYQDPQGSPLDSEAQFRLREYHIDYQAPLEPPLDAEARVRREEFEERRRIHDRLPEDISLQDQLSSLRLGDGHRPDRFGRPERGDERGHAQQRFDESRFDERPRWEAGMGGRAYGGFDEPSFGERPRRGAGMDGMTNYGDFGGRRETAREILATTRYGRDPYSDQHGRDTGIEDTPHLRNTGNPYGVEAGRGASNRFQRETRPGRRETTTRQRSQYESLISPNGDLLAEFERNPEAQRIYRENTERWLTEEERDDTFFVRWRKELATREALRIAARDRLDHARRRPSDRRR